jgi:hypothetical protein
MQRRRFKNILSQIVSTKRSNASGRKPKNSLQATMSVRCFCARRGKPRPPCASTIGFHRPGFNRRNKAASVGGLFRWGTGRKSQFLF